LPVQGRTLPLPFYAWYNMRI